MDRSLKHGENLIGSVFNRWTIESLKRKNRILLVFCRCSCGRKRWVNFCSLQRGLSKSCGCLNLEKLHAKGEIIPAGKVFGRWTVLSTTRSGGKFRALCRCVCGKEKFVSVSSLKRDSRSCGCFAAEFTRKRCTRHGHAAGGKMTRIYSNYLSMLDRCRNPNAPAYAAYGGRGIKVCKRWAESFAAFMEDIGRCRPPGGTLERKDNNRGYSPDNVTWATRKEQARNRRSSRLLTLNGETLCLAAWSEKTGLLPDCISQRVDKLGWTVQKALTTPSNQHKK